MVEFSLTAPEPIETRFKPFKAIIETEYKKHGWLLRWGAQDGDQLSRLLKEMPDLTELVFHRAVKNMTESGDVPKGQRPSNWLPKIESYIVEAHNSFGKNHSDVEWDMTAKERIQHDQLRRSQGLIH